MERTTKYMLLMQFSEPGVDFPRIDAWTPGEIRAHMEFVNDVNKKLADGGEWVDDQGLAMPEAAKIARAGTGGGPYDEPAGAAPPDDPRGEARVGQRPG
ncbi:hypothetical protein [Streptomyces wuyuanensis]|uniref:hypothetical protein n=1 Tax=Streptomyces wuyuanensis TaxID=1196353 RepID=UPI0037979242